LHSSARTSASASPSTLSDPRTAIPASGLARATELLQKGIDARAGRLAEVIVILSEEIQRPAFGGAAASIAKASKLIPTLLAAEERDLQGLAAVTAGGGPPGRATDAAGDLEVLARARLYRFIAWCRIRRLRSLSAQCRDLEGRLYVSFAGIVQAKVKFDRMTYVAEGVPFYEDYLQALAKLLMRAANAPYAHGSMLAAALVDLHRVAVYPHSLSMQSSWEPMAEREMARVEAEFARSIEGLPGPAGRTIRRLTPLLLALAHNPGREKKEAFAAEATTRVRELARSVSSGSETFARLARALDEGRRSQRAP
jgi:hypothetical protein